MKILCAAFTFRVAVSAVPGPAQKANKATAEESHQAGSQPSRKMQGLQDAFVADWAGDRIL